MLLLAARPVGLERPAHAVEFIEDDDGTLLADTTTLCGRLATEDTDLDLTRPQPFAAVDPDQQCATCSSFASQGGRSTIPVVRSPGVL